MLFMRFLAKNRKSALLLFSGLLLTSSPRVRISHDFESAAQAIPVYETGSDWYGIKPITKSQYEEFYRKLLDWSGYFLLS